jgi:hypothetical protein
MAKAVPFRFAQQPARVYGAVRLVTHACEAVTGVQTVIMNELQFQTISAECGA